ncbi:mycothiol-dependent maleylpyruvate isomerase [Mycolicibacterium phlei]|uniref:Mycothiol-dependent maleylpyruvate isomerase metal-binding domain-containing protein n=1 Tax=Mycolicibacterium phlei DSM 43239 = CCUG 21000 TaxID=1226750 RepID=A0A5N5VAM2_MYCPH|nr:maleylpyruvate isomerase N-terminal domain-containing protein [Mycolicibacterium phlei]VEG09942.1 mycothiol-dependent maleylpyruvate isomerase [Mycobacteroides chelonae]AMO61835.1 mycothiol-dependent maleylpyruvate isomerase [Mycolicibacterium phlei]EID11009.1 hypothetical protein MPHLEI_20114 [Mycolicibacterium phlei RIVM601174]KAB7758818.1 hypothetical protein MPHL21000_05335 [Mycolicibacterium phlei DSM 43239 = CCUG 21000]KXW63843.1 hypothetical protein MPHL43070_23285 [Mycolicibacterium
MRLDAEATRAALADAWERWARRCAELTEKEWSAPTRCGGWDVAALLGHVCPEPTMFDRIAATVADPPAAVTDAAILLRRFNEPDGVANTGAERLAAQAVADATVLTPRSASDRFAESARALRDNATPPATVIAYPHVGSTTLAVITEVALMESTVHLLDLAAAVGGVEPSPEALAATRDLLVAVPDPTAAVEVLAGRRAPSGVVPVIR